MGLWPFGRKDTEDRNVDRLLEEANAANPTVSPTASPAGAPTGTFAMPVDDVFTIAGRGVVVTGRIQAGVVTPGQPASVVRNGAVVVTTRINAIEKFRAVTDSATTGENVGLLLDAVSRGQVMSGDLVQG
jgi:translation elongation factor EF-Tu-like GTPase